MKIAPAERIMSKTRVALLDRDSRSAITIRDYIQRSFNADIEWGDDTKFLESVIPGFKPSILIVGDMLPVDSEFGEEIAAHRRVVEWILKTFSKKPYVVALTGRRSYPTRDYQRFCAVCEEFGYDYAISKIGLDAMIIALWFRQAERKSEQ